MYSSYYEKIDGEIKCLDDDIPFDLPDGWSCVRLCDLLDYEQPTQYIVESTDYKSEHKTPVLTAGKTFIIGYTNETRGIRENLPVIIFDDFTTQSKLVNFPFKVKSSAMKILTSKSRAVSLRYAFYMMQCVECDSYNHKRYWISDFSQKIVALPPVLEQRRILQAIDLYNAKIELIEESLN